MGILANKKVLIAGMISDRSIAYGIAEAMKREGAELAFSYQNERIKDRVSELASHFDSKIVLPCDVASDAEIDNLFAELGKHWDGLDAVVHSLAFVPRAGLTGDFIEGCTRENFQVAMDVSAYSFVALARAARPLMQGRNGSLLTLTYLGSERVLPNYNLAGVTKAALEACVRYMAESLGGEGIRVNAISAGPIKTLAASGIAGFSKILGHVEKTAPLRRNVTQEEVGNVAAFLCSDLASAVTGEVTFVDSGFNITGGMPAVE